MKKKLVPQIKVSSLYLQSLFRSQKLRCVEQTRVVIILQKKLYTRDLGIYSFSPYSQEASCYFFDNKTWNEFIQKNGKIYLTIWVGWGPDVFQRTKNILWRTAISKEQKLTQLKWVQKTKWRSLNEVLQSLRHFMLKEFCDTLKTAPISVNSSIILA